MIGNKSRHTATDSSAHIHQCTVVHIIHAGQRRIITVGHGNGHRGLAACCKAGDGNIIQLVLFNIRIGRRIGQFAHCQTRAGFRRHADTGAIIREGLGRRHGHRLRAIIGVSISGNNVLEIGSVTITIRISGMGAGTLQHMRAIRIIAADGNLVARDLKCRHGEGAVSVGVILIVADITGVHISEVQRLLHESGRTAVGHIKGVAFFQIDGRSAKESIMILGMVMAEQEDNVQFLRGSVDRIKNRLGVPCSTIMCNARTGVQRNMRNHKNRFIVTGLNLRIKICSKTRCQRPAVAQTAIICCIIVLIQYIYAVIVGIIRTGGGNAANLTVVVALNEYLVNI